MRALRLVTAVALVGLATGLPVAISGAGAQEQVKTAAVKIVDFDFDAKDITVDVGTTVTWTNTGNRPHTVTDRGGTFDSDPLAPNATDAIVFTVPGKYSYFCRINPSKMNGTITVNAGATPAKVNRIQTLDPAREGAQLSFDPSTLTVEAGSTIVLANVGGKPHTLTADDGSFDTGVVTPGAEGGRFAGKNASLSVPKPGTFAFHCEVHAVMKGTLTVTGEEKAAPAAASTAPRKVNVDMEGIAFKPAQKSIAPGGTVTWKNLDSAQHNAKFDDEDLETELIGKDETVSLKAPTKPGSYSYFCQPHAQIMRAVLVVVGANTGDPAAGAGAAPAALVAAKGPGGGITFGALATGVAGAFLGGFGIAAFLVRRRSSAT
jgi:plastocyanin